LKSYLTKAQGRCGICTLRPPCAHQPDIQAEEQDGGSLAKDYVLATNDTGHVLYPHGQAGLDTKRSSARGPDSARSKPQDRHSVSIAQNSLDMGKLEQPSIRKGQE